MKRSADIIVMSLFCAPLFLITASPSVLHGHKPVALPKQHPRLFQHAHILNRPVLLKSSCERRSHTIKPWSYCNVEFKVHAHILAIITKTKNPLSWQGLAVPSSLTACTWINEQMQVCKIKIFVVQNSAFGTELEDQRRHENRKPFSGQTYTSYFTTWHTAAGRCMTNLKESTVKHVIGTDCISRLSEIYHWVIFCEKCVKENTSKSLLKENNNVASLHQCLELSVKWWEREICEVPNSTKEVYESEYYSISGIYSRKKKHSEIVITQSMQVNSFHLLSWQQH